MSKPSIEILLDAIDWIPIDGTDVYESDLPVARASCI